MIHYVYLLRTENADRHKIGICGGRLRNRLRAIQTSCPFPLYLVDVWSMPSKKDALRVEREFLEDFSGKTCGEWVEATLREAVLTVWDTLRNCGHGDPLTISWRFCHPGDDSPPHPQLADVGDWFDCTKSTKRRSVRSIS